MVTPGNGLVGVNSLSDERDEFGDQPVPYSRRLRDKIRKVLEQEQPISTAKTRGDRAAYSRRKSIPAKIEEKPVREVLDHRRLPGD